MFYQWLLIAIGFLCAALAIQVKPGPVYGPPTVQKHRFPQREYGVPQKIPFREYGPPALKYGPPKFIKNFGGNNVGISSGLHEQIKTHFGVPKPFYGPPVSYKPAALYGLPQRQPSVQYSVPALKIQHKPASQYGPPKLHHTSIPPQSLPLIQPTALFKPEHQPSSSYGPPPSGPITQEPKQNYGPPANTYGPPQLPNFNHGPETTLLVTTVDNPHHHHHHHQQQQHQQQQHKQQQHQQQQLYHQLQQQHNSPNAAHKLHVQIDTHGHTHSGGGGGSNGVGGSGGQTPFHTACEGWKPIPGPSTGTFIDHNNVHTQSGYSHVAQGGHAGHVETLKVETSASDSDLTNEQLVAVALQSGSFDGSDNALHTDIQIPPHTGPGIQFHQHHQHHQKFNSANDLHATLGAIGDTYSKPPSDSYAPGSIHTLKYHEQLSSQSPNSQHEFPLHTDHSSANFVHHHVQHGLGIQYGKQSGNLQSYPQIPLLPPTKPVAFRPPVPQGLLETIGATVKHVDAFGQRPIEQVPTYIPPAANEIALGSTSNLNAQYGPPLNMIEQQLPRETTSNSIYASHQQQTHYQQQQQYQHTNNIHDVYGLPSQNLPQTNYLPPLSGPSAPSNEYSPPLSHTNEHTLNQQNQQNGITYTAKAIATFENAYGASEQNHQSLPLQQQQQQHQQQNTGYQGSDCGQGPLLLNGISSNSISQSIPIAEHHSQFYTEPTNSYGPPPSGNVDNLSFASENSGHSTLPINNYQDLEDSNVISAQIPSDNTDYHNQIAPSYQLEINRNPKQSINHEEILSHDLLQTILSSIEQQPQSQPQTKYLPANHKAEYRLDRNDQLANDKQFDIDNETAHSEPDASIVKSIMQEENNEEQKLLKAIIVNEEEDAQDQDNAKH